MKPRLLGSAVTAAAVATAGALCLAQAPASTPRTPDGHVDLSGIWNGAAAGPANAKVDAAGNITVQLASREGTPVNFERDNTLRRRADPNKPIYKPELWEKVQYFDDHGNKEDPSFHCMPNGVPRMGPPTKIVQTSGEVIFLYEAANTFRIIPLNRAHHPEKSLEPTWMGDSVGRWDGDTLVVDTIGFNDRTWLDIAGYFHSEKLLVVERLRRDGNSLHYQATVEDPEVLVKPWVMNPRVLRLNTAPDAALWEDVPCDERDEAHLTTSEHH